MKEKTRKILIMAVMAALIISLMAASLCYAFTYGRYSGGRLDDNSTYDDLIDFVGATAFEVSTPDEFVNAVENGYSYIKISEGAEKPFVINNDIADVYTNLVLDVNGTTVIRNSRNPVLDVRRSISVVLVYDSSVEGSGGFYNPVGSALQTSGGSLTVGSGSYESGPKVKGSSSFSSDTSVTLYTRTSRTAGSYETKVEDTSMPSLSGDVYYTGDTTQYTYIENDTYLLYTEVKNAFVGKGETSDDATFESGQLYVNCKEFTTDGTQTTYSADIFAPDSNVASCDFYYYYPIDESGAYSSTAGTVDSPKTYAVVYGYNDVKGLAEDEDDNNDGIGEATALIDDGLVWPYAAIRSVEDGEVGGVTHARGGTFTTNFGTDNTYGIYSVGGTMTVGTDSASTPPKFTATGEGTCIGMSAGENDTLTIASGNFSSQVGDTILMRGGEMTVTGGTFTKTGSHPVPTGNPTATDYAASRTALIHMLGGDLTVNGTVTGESDSRTYSVNMTAGSTDAPLTNVFGIYSTETTDETTGKAVEGTVTILGCKITVNGTYSAGVLSSAGTVNVGGTENGKADTDITVANSIESDQLTSSAVSSEGGIINLNNTVNISSDSLGITARGEVNVMSGTTKVNTENATGVYVNNGTLTVKNNATLEVESKIYNANYSWVTPPGTSEPTNAPNIYNGVYVQNGSLDSSEGTLNVTFTGVQNESKYDIDTLLETYGITLPTIGESGMGSTTQRFWDNDNTDWNDFYTDYQKFNTPSFQEVQQAVSYAVRVEAGGSANTTVKIASGNITNSVGGGVLVNGGKVTLGETDLKIHAEGNETIDKTYIYTFTRNTGKDYHDWWWRDYYEYTIEVRSAMYFAEIDDPAQNWAYRENQTGGDAVRVEGGELTIEDGEYTSAQGNGIVAVGGKTTIDYGTFNGSDNYKVKDGNGLVVPAGPAASYAFKVYGGEITVNAGMFGDPDSASGASGGFVMGTSADAPGTAYINGGTFAVSSGKTGGQAGFGVYRYANVTFGQEGTTGNIQVTGLAAGLVLERTPGDSGTTVTINRGTFSSTRIESGTSSDGVWYGNGTSKLNITGDSEFTGAGRSGIQLDENPSNNVRITGGTFVANQGYPISGYFDQVVPSEYGIISGSNTWGSSCTIG